MARMHDALPAREHNLFIIDLVAAITAQNKPRAAAGLIGDLLIAACVFDHPTLEMFGGGAVVIVPGTDKKLGV